MGLGGFRNLRDANVWHRGINQLRTGHRAAGKARAHRLAAMKSRRRRTSGSQAQPTAPNAAPPSRLVSEANRRHLNSARRNLGLWRRGRDFVRAALGLGRAVRQSVLARAAGSGRQAMQIDLRNRTRGMRAASRDDTPQTGGIWAQLSKQMKSGRSLGGTTKSFRTRKLRRLSLRLIERAFGHRQQSNRPEEIRR